jgi:hypothetical protein
MKFLVVGAEQLDAPRKPRCADCRKRLRAGQVVVTFEQGPEVYVDHSLFVHRSHFDAVLADAPREEEALDAEIAAVVAEARRAGRSAVEVLLGA